MPIRSNGYNSKDINNINGYNSVFGETFKIPNILQGCFNLFTAHFVGRNL
jgi:hypothetical protein